MKIIEIQTSPHYILILFPQNKDNYIVFSTYQTPTQLHLFETGGFIR